MSTVDFKITGTVSGAHPSSGIGADVVAGETLTFQIEATPALDLREVEFSVVVKSAAGAPAWTWTPATGKPATPTGTVTVVVPASLGPWSYLVRCQGNGGKDAAGKDVADWTRERIVAVRKNGVRHMVPSESTQYNATYGWPEMVNGIASAVLESCVDIDSTDSPYTVPAGVTTVRVSTHAGAVTVLFGAVVSFVDTSVQVLDWHGDAATNNITLDCTDSTLNGVAAGGASVKINTAFGGAVVHCDGIVRRTTQATV